MADAMGEPAFAEECRDLAAKGGAYVDRELFNGRYYAQKLDLSDRSVLTPFDQGRKAGVLERLLHGGLLVGRVRRDQISDRRAAASPIRSSANGTPISPGLAICSTRKTCGRR